MKLAMPVMAAVAVMRSLRTSMHVSDGLDHTNGNELLLTFFASEVLWDFVASLSVSQIANTCSARL